MLKLPVSPVADMVSSAIVVYSEGNLPGLQGIPQSQV